MGRDCVGKYLMTGIEESRDLGDGIASTEEEEEVKILKVNLGKGGMVDVTEPINGEWIIEGLTKVCLRGSLRPVHQGRLMVGSETDEHDGKRKIRMDSREAVTFYDDMFLYKERVVRVVESDPGLCNGWSASSSVTAWFIKV